jgi:DNA-binding transcriptional ArsR family regulator
VVVSMTVVADVDALERVGTALADATRRRILVRLVEGPAYPGELAELLGLGRANISNHLACLRGCGLVAARREGRFVRYSLTSAELCRALQLLARVELACELGHADLDGRR